MKTNTTTIILGVALMVVGGFFTATVTGLFSIQPVQTSSSSLASTGAYMTGHVTTILTDSEGNIKEYRQGDNVITNVGENCVAKLLFHDDGVATGQGGDTTTAGGACTGQLNAPWDVIAIGTSTTKANGTNVVLGTELSGSGLTRARGLVAYTNSSGTAATSTNTVTVTKTFTNSGTSVQVAESGLFNSTTASGSGLFARQNFTAIGLGNGDSLQVVWTINIGGTQFNLAQ